MLHELGGKLDSRIYDSFYLHRVEPKHYKAVQLVKSKDLAKLQNDQEMSSTLIARAFAQAGADAAGTSLDDWCLSFTRLHSPSAAAEVDRCQADSKFFRSFAVVMLAAVIVSLAGRSRIAVVGSALMFLFSLWRFCVLRWEATKRVYEFYLLIHKYPTRRDEPSKGAV